VQFNCDTSNIQWIDGHGAADLPGFNFQTYDSYVLNQLNVDVNKFDYVIYMVNGLVGGNGGVWGSGGRGGRVRVADNTNQQIFNHELGHTFGIVHSVWANTNNADPSDVMGIDTTVFSSVWREYAGWTSDTSFVSLDASRVQSPISVTIKDMMSASKSDLIGITYKKTVQNAVNIQSASSPYTLGYLYVDYSKGLVAVRAVPIVSQKGDQFSIWLMAQLQFPGDKYVDSLGEGITITLVGKDASSATLSISRS
jgi:hypothetical protein